MTDRESEAAVIGGGPAGLMAAEVLAEAGHRVTVFDRMPSLGRKLLLAGRGGLNLTHSEDLTPFLGRYGARATYLEPALRAFPPAALVAWSEALGEPTFVGSSGRVFPKAMKASPLLRKWLRRLASRGVSVAFRHEWRGWRNGSLVFDTPDGERLVDAGATVLALGGASWPRMGSDGNWVGALHGVRVARFRPANCGFHVAWSKLLRDTMAGQPLKRIAITFDGRTVRGEAMIDAHGIEGSAVYALSAALRDAISERGPVQIALDLRPDITHAELERRAGVSRRGQTLSTFLRKSLGLSPPAIALVQEVRHAGGDLVGLAELVKALPLTLTSPFPLERAISTAGGVEWDELDEDGMLRARPGVFVAGEMLDWEAPTGGYLLQAAMATGRMAGAGAASHLARGANRSAA